MVNVRMWAGTLALVLAGCGGEGADANTTVAAAVNAEAASAPLPAPTPAQAAAEPASATLRGVADSDLPGTEVPSAELYGRWTVEKVAADASAPAGFRPDQALVGRTLRYDADTLGWEDGSGEVEAQDRCDDPTKSMLHTAAIARNLARPFRPAWSALGVPLDQVGAAHAWECDTPDHATFGPDEGIFFPVGRDGLVLNWRNHAILLLRRAQ